MGGWRRMDGVNAKREGEVVVVAVDASKEITDYALEWAIRNVLQPKDTLILLALLKSSVSSGKLQLQAMSSNHNSHSNGQGFLTSLLKKWGLRKDSKKVKESPIKVSNRLYSGNGVEEEEMRQIHEVCSEMMNDLCCQNNVKQVLTQVKILPCANIVSVANKAEEFHASWVILDRCLKKESENCSRRLNCNIIQVDHAIPKILQLVNNAAVTEEESRKANLIAGRNQSDGSLRSSSNNISSSLGFSSDQDGAAAPPTKSAREFKPSRLSPPQLPPTGMQSLDNMSKFSNNHLSAKPPISRKGTNKNIEGKQESLTQSRRSVDSATSILKSEKPSTQSQRRSFRDGSGSVSTETIAPLSTAIHPTGLERTSSIRRAMSISIKQPPTPPPLCSVCKHSSPVFGKPPKMFSYQEMERATDGFAAVNFLAEGGYGPVFRGVLENGQVVAVKKHKKASAQGAAEFCSEVEVLSCAQHRNLVMLVGYCMEREQWLLVYEFACNGSLDKHLHGDGTKEVMAWQHRQKVAIGAASGLRYLHEDCRVGCIVHRDLRPNNILLTHDFEPMVGDFGLARCQMDGQSAEETRVVGTLGYVLDLTPFNKMMPIKEALQLPRELRSILQYLAPEYTQTGQITEKADVYAFGVLLMELISGLKAMDLIRRETIYLRQWATPLIERMTINELVDPRLNGNYVEREVECMMHVASLCILPDPETRPRISKVLRMLEGDMPSDNGSHRRSQTPTPISRSSDSASHQRSQTPTLNLRFNLTTSSSLQTKSFNSPYEESKLVQKRYGLLVDEELRSNNVMKPTSLPQNDTTGINEPEKVSNRRIPNQSDHLTTKEYQTYLQDSFFEFMRKTKGASNS